MPKQTMSEREAYWFNRGVADRGWGAFPFDAAYSKLHPEAVKAYQSAYAGE